MTRTEIINHFIEKSIYRQYCEIGVFNKDHNFNKINADYKYCVDPDPKCEATHIGTSDDFFSFLSNKFSVYFIDGLHTAIQVFKDVNNALLKLWPDGTIIVHDLVPTSEPCQRVPRMQGEWTGDCWMAWLWLRATRHDLTMYVLDTDYGVGVIQQGKQELLNINCNITYQNFVKNKKEWLNLVGVDYINKT